MLKKATITVGSVGLGGGVVLGTMYLTNHADTTLNSLAPLDIDEKPEIEETPIQPQEKPKPPTPQEPSPPQQQQGGQQQNQQGAGGSPTEGSPGSPSSSSSSSSNSSALPKGEQSIEELIKSLMQEINAKQHKWTSNGSLISRYEIWSRIDWLKEALDKYKTSQSSG